jgi:hypothetical protein
MPQYVEFEDLTAVALKKSTISSAMWSHIVSLSLYLSLSFLLLSLGASGIRETLRFASVS